MPLLNSSYHPPALFQNAHLNTIGHAVLRKVKQDYTRERISTPDEDFIDLDFSKKGSKKVLLIIHGLEGSAQSSYVKGMVKASNAKGWDAVVLNFRGCSGSMNKSFGAYHSGQTADVKLAITHLVREHHYQEIFLVGYSLGGNVLLKLLGEDSLAHLNVKASVAVSVPCHLEHSALELEKWYNKIYLMTFLNSLRKKVSEKYRQTASDLVDIHDILNAKNFTDFDNAYTAPVNGFKSAKDYWTRSSSLFYLSGISSPTLLINALDDPFLSPSCFPFEQAKQSKCLFLETPEKGGHVGFVTHWNAQGLYWHEHRIMEFFETV